MQTAGIPKQYLQRATNVVKNVSLGMEMQTRDFVDSLFGAGKCAG